MREREKSYLDLFLENSEKKQKKNERYFEQKEENAIIEYNSEYTTKEKKNFLFETIIMPAFKSTIAGILEMPQFHWIAFHKKINRDELLDATFEKLLQKIHLFTPDMIGKNGQKVKAFSYFTVIARNYITEYTNKIKKVIENKADVEMSIDLCILSDENLERIVSDKDSTYEIEINDYISVFNSSKKTILNILENVLIKEKNQDKLDENTIKIGHLLKYLINNWDKFEIENKNEFMRMLTLYSGFSQQKVSILFKKFKNAVLKEINPGLLASNLYQNKKAKVEETEEYEDEEEVCFDEENLEENPVNLFNEKDRILNLEVLTFEDFEIKNERLENYYKKEKWKQKSLETNPN